MFQRFKDALALYAGGDRQTLGDLEAGCGDVVHAEHACAQPGAHSQGGDRPLGPLADRQAERLADEVLVRHRDEDRPAGARQFAEAPGHLE